MTDIDYLATLYVLWHITNLPGYHEMTTRVFVEFRTCNFFIFFDITLSLPSVMTL